MYNIPTHFHINVTNKCNLNCKQCYAARNNDTMTVNVLQKVAKHIYNLYQYTGCKQDMFGITISGGEIGYFDTDLICDFIDGLQVLMPEVHFDIECVSNLIYTLENRHLRLFDKANRISLSYDFGDVRFTSVSQRKLWFNNAMQLLTRYGKERIEIYTCLTSEMIEAIGPSELMDMFYMLPFKKYEIHELCKPIRPEQQDRIKDITPDWDKVNEYLYKAFLRYIEYRPELRIETLECMIASYNGDFYYEHSRKCQEDYITFYPTGISYGCAMNDDAGFDSLDINTEQLIQSANRVQLINAERTLNDKCLTCKWLDKCNGGCDRRPWQGDKCATPTLIYEYLEKHNIK